MRFEGGCCWYEVVGTVCIKMRMGWAFGFSGEVSKNGYVRFLGISGRSLPTAPVHMVATVSRDISEDYGIIRSSVKKAQCVQT